MNVDIGIGEDIRIFIARGVHLKSMEKEKDRRMRRIVGKFHIERDM